MALKLVLDQDQLDTVEYGVTNPYSIIAVAPGGGKSAIALTIKEKVKSPRVLVVAPANLTINWYKEIYITLTDQVVSLFKSKKDVYYPVDSDIVIVSYETAIAFEYLFEWATMVVLDEATAIKNMEAKRTKGIHKLIYENNVPRVYPMTGTPLKNRVREFYSLIALCNYNPKIAESKFLTEFANEVDFADRFSHRKEFDRYFGNRRVRIVQWEGLKNEEELKKHLKGIYISKKSKRAAPNVERYLYDDTDDMELLKEFLESEGMSGSAVNPKAKVASAIKKVPMTIKHVEEKIENGQIEGPVIIFTDHIEPCELLAKHFNVEPITGKMTPTNRQKMVDRFQAGELPFLVASIGSLNQGYTLIRSNYICFNDFCWVPGDMKQCFFRIDRKGQTRPCFVDLIFGSPQDEYIYQTQMGKLEVIEKMY